MQYRREIDGLRAVAVLPVILFHAGFGFWSGGFVGVDVFFVISGYLITSILIAEREAGTYSLMGFYERRARRILPALFVVLLVTIPFAWAWIPPYPYEDYARSLAFASLFISNIHFLEHGGYFDLNADLRPLLHTWSLAVEEQYYLLFPLILMALGKFRRARHLWVFLALAALSLAVAEWGWRTYPNQNFYFTPARFWEMLAGSACAVLLYQRTQMKNELLAGLGLVLIVVTMVVFNASVPFPSVYALVPVVGTVLIILFAEKQTLTARILSMKPLVGIGLISYSAYLWHQPLFAFARLRNPDELSLWIMSALAVAALGLAYLSWRFIEQPVRGRAPKVFPTRRGVLTASFVGIVGFAAFGLTGKFQEGYPSRLNLGQSAFLDQLYLQTTEHAAFSVCGNTSRNVVQPMCVVYGAGNTGRKIAVLGDSHSRALLPSFEQAAKVLDAQIYLGDKPGCSPILGVHSARGGLEARVCHDAMQAHAKAIADGGFDAVVLVARWSLYATGNYDGPDPQFRISEVAGKRFVSEETRRAAFENGLKRTVKYFEDAGVHVLIVNQAPQQTATPGITVQNAMILGLSDDEARDWFAHTYITRDESDRLQAYARSVTAGLGVDVLTLDEVFAEADRFAWIRGDDALFMDDDHVSDASARYLAPLVTQALQKLLAP